MSVLTGMSAPADRDERPAPRRGTGAASRLWQASPLTYLALVFACLISIFPLYFMVVGASRSNSDLSKVPPPLTPAGNLFVDAGRVFDNQSANILTGLWNSILISSAITVSTVFFGSLAGFAFAKLKFRGKNALLLFILGTMMVPLQLGLIPLYILTIKLGWHNTIWAVIVPFMISGFGVFMMRQYAAQAVPDELIESARVDGCSTWRIYFNVVLPALRPAAAVLGLLTFMQTWNDFLWPLVAMQDPNRQVVQVSIAKFRTVANYPLFGELFAAACTATLPLLLLFFVLQRHYVRGMLISGMK